MKSSYELAMERLNKTAPVVKLTDRQKAEIDELESNYKAKVADREIFLKGEIARAVDKGDFETVEQLEKQLISDRKTFRTDLDKKKEKVRQRKNGK